MDFEQLNWAILDRLRSGFLSGSAADGVYWKNHDDLEQYDRTFGERIGWKWDAVLHELSARGWRPQKAGGKLTLLDWGCGSGVAGRRVVAHFGSEIFEQVLVWDHSPLARTYSCNRARDRFPGLSVAEYEVAPEPVGFKRQKNEARKDRTPTPEIDVLVISHVMNELDQAARDSLLALIKKSTTVLWVEPGTHALSRDLIALREKVRGEFRMVAPCTHNAVCGLLAPQNSQHWCHAHAAPPPSLYADSGWVKFGQRAGIDLRSLPYAFLVMEKLPAPLTVPADGRDFIGREPDREAGAERIIDEPRQFKGHAKVLSCAEPGVRELLLQKRDAPPLFKHLKRELGTPIYKWELQGDRIHGGAEVYPADNTAPEEPTTSE